MTNVTTLALGGTTNVASGSVNGMSYFRHEINIAEAVTAGLATTEKVRIANIPADTFFELKQIEVVNALGDTITRVDVGDSDADTTFVNNASTLTAGTNLTLATTGKFYSAADTLELKITGTSIDSGLVRFVYGMVDCTRIAAGTSPVTP